MMGQEIRREFHRELSSLRDRVCGMGAVVLDCVERATDALFSGDLSKAEEVLGKRQTIRALDKEIEDECIVFMATQQPVALDLRLISTFLHVIVSLERIFGLAANIARICEKLREGLSRNEAILRSMKEMSSSSIEVLRESLRALHELNLELSMKLDELDSVVDESYVKLVDKFSRLKSDNGIIRWATLMLLASRYYERIGDHAVNIGERVAYALTGSYSLFHH